MLHAVLAGVVALLAAADGNIVVYTQDLPHLIADEFRDLPASFGPDLPYDGLRGLLVVGEPADGCGNMTAPPSADNFTDKWIVLVARFNCNFETKVRNAMAAGYDCVIVHNVNSSDLETMSAKNPEGIDIPSVFVSDLAGARLGEKYTYKYEYYMMVNGDLPFNINTHLLLPFAVVVALCLIIIIIFMIVKCIKDRRRARRHRLPNRSLKKIPTCKFSKGDPYDTCAICLDDYLEGERLRVLPCAHAYHAKCVDPWLTQNRRVCPVCKRRVLAAGEREVRARGSDSDDSDAPLLDEPTQTITQGGTFVTQRENPFSRAARLVSRLRAPRATDVEEATVSEENVQPTENEETTSDTRALLHNATRAAGGRVRASRRRRARSAHAAPTPAPAPPAPPAPPVHAPFLTVGGHSINTETGGEIGVAALPAPAPPAHVDL